MEKCSLASSHPPAPAPQTFNGVAVTLAEQQEAVGAFGGVLALAEKCGRRGAAPSQAAGGYEEGRGDYWLLCIRYAFQCIR